VRRTVSVGRYRPDAGRCPRGSLDAALRVQVDRANFEAAQARFGELGIEFESADHGIAQSVYISDPDGHRIEITTYEV